MLPKTCAKTHAWRDTGAILVAWLQAAPEDMIRPPHGPGRDCSASVNHRRIPRELAPKREQWQALQSVEKVKDPS